MSIEYEIALATLEVSQQNLATAKLAHEKMTLQLDTRVMTLASMAATIISNAHPNFGGCNAKEAVKLAKEVLDAAEETHRTEKVEAEKFKALVNHKCDTLEEIRKCPICAVP